MKRYFFPWILLGFCLPVAGWSQTANVPFLPVSEAASAGAFPLAAEGQTATIVYDAADAAVVGVAARALSEDVQRVTGQKPGVATGAPTAGESAVFVGTLGKSALIDGLVANGKIEVGPIRGKWEAYTAAVVEEPVPGVKRALVIAGSDRRGTAFGIFGLSEAMGVSPWYWWADVTPAKKAALYVGSGVYTEPSPGVKYRGIFLNDEDWGLQPWAAKTFEPETGDIGPKTYAKIFELLLRLHANFIWPAMHDCTHPFNYFPQNKVVADRYAIVMGSSHHEPMLRDTSEYDPKKLGPYNYWTNRQNIYDFWRDRVRENSKFENIYTIGMRGPTDGEILAPKGATLADKVKELQDFIIPDQRKILGEELKTDPATVPQTFVPYKEALVQYQAGLQVPDDVTLVWPDDNHGYIRHLPTTAERQRRGGSGIYYHLSYWGAPKDYLWLCTTPPAFTWEEMSKAWDYGARRLWIVNVGDLKPGEIGMDFFLRLARNPEAFRGFSQHEYLKQWATRAFGAEAAEDIAKVMDQYYRLNIQVRPEHLNPVRSGFSFVGWGERSYNLVGDEAQDRLAAFSDLVEQASKAGDRVPKHLQDAYYELVTYPVKASEMQNRKVLVAERSRLYAAQGQAHTGVYAERAQEADKEIKEETAHYNTVLAGGKWDRMMSDHPHPTAGDVFGPPVVGRYDPPAAAGLGVTVEGQSEPLPAGQTGELPTFSLADPMHYVNVYMRGKEAVPWTVEADVPWITIKQKQEAVDDRVIIGTEWTKAPKGVSSSGIVTIKAGGETWRVRATWAEVARWGNGGSKTLATERVGAVLLPAYPFTEAKDGADGTGWRKVEGVVAVGSANSFAPIYDGSRSDPPAYGVTILPTTAASVEAAALAKGSPSLVYPFETVGTGPVTLHSFCLPTHRVNDEHPGQRFAVALNDEAPQVVNIDADEWTPAWNVNVLRASAEAVSKHTIAKPGQQTLRVWMVDAGVVLDHFRLEIGAKASGEFEAEALTMVGSSGAKFRVFDEAAASAGAAVAFEAKGAGEFFIVALPEMKAGVYEVSVRVKRLDNRGVVRLAVGEAAGGPFRELGGEMDLYSAKPEYAELAGGRMTMDGAAGGKFLRFEVTGKNPANTSGAAWVAVDRLEFRPVVEAEGTAGR